MNCSAERMSLASQCNHSALEYVGNGGHTILEVEFDGRTVGSFAHPYVEIFALARLKVEDIVAVIEVCEFVELVKFGLCV